MIIREFYRKRKDKVNLYKTYSDKGVYVMQIPTGIEYPVAVDTETSTYTYEETDKPIKGDKNDKRRKIQGIS